MKHFLHSFKSWSSLYYVGKRVSKHGRDVLLHGRSQQIVNGNALVARLLESALRLNVSFVLNACVSDIGEADEAGARSVVLLPPPCGHSCARCSRRRASIPRRGSSR